MEIKKNITIQKLFWYFIIFSILGLIIETTYGYITMGEMQCRKGLIWGPFCPVYGVGATLLIWALSYTNTKSSFKLFIYGILIGSAIEYLLSYGMEAVLGVRFWDYSYTGKDINGRICILYSLFWGLLSVVLLKEIKPLIDKIIDKIPTKINNIIEIALFIFIIIDIVATGWGVSTYKKRAINGKNYNIQINVEENNIFLKIKNKIETEYFTNERMQAIYPNLRVETDSQSEVWIKDIS